VRRSINSFVEFFHLVIATLHPPPVRSHRRASSPDSAQALFRTFASTLALLRWLLGGSIALYLFSGVTRVAPNEDALIFRLGRLQDGVHSPGLLFALPPPFDRVVKIPTRTQHDLNLTQWSPEESALIYGSTRLAPTASSSTSSRPAFAQRTRRKNTFSP